ncbi:MAG TPA: hypothetical protein P5060_03410 [Candidatus Absconditabacterales bacterium]|nr:hypothetical protein [Candidatus Absconditabacterales bacterium]
MYKKTYEFISKQTNDPILERRKCKISGEDFAIFQSDIDFYDKISPTFNGKKYQIPRPTLCPEERMRRRLLFKNERALFRNKCDLTEKSIISTHAPDSGFKVYNVKSWRSDDRDAIDYQREYDLGRSFFDQYKDLYFDVPQIAMMNDHAIKSENIEYCQNVAYSKNCYLTTVARKLEHTYYSSNMAGGNWLIDCFFTMESENCYECCDSNHLYGCFWLQYSYDCQSCWFGYDLSGCQDCIACVNLRNKKYCIFNKQYTQQEYETQKDNLLKHLNKDPEKIKKKFYDFVATQVHRATYNTNATNTYSSNLYNAENAIMCYNVQNIKDSKYCVFGDTMEDAMDLTVGGELNLCYEGNVPDHSYKACFTVFCRSCTNIYYSEMCHNCQDCFACVGLRNKQYCILNKQYTKEEYGQKVAEIVEKMQSDGERGEFFPSDLAPYPYNISTVMDYFPLNKKEATEKGYKRREKIEEINVPEDITLIEAKDLGYSSSDISDEILQKGVVCQESGRPFRILKPELDFYKKWNIPFPHKHPDIRFEERLQRMPPKELNIRKCDKTQKEVLSVYGQDVSFSVYSQEAYKQEFYS